MADKVHPGPIRAIKHPFKLLLVGSFIIFGLFLTNQAVLGFIEEDFDSYPQGVLTGNGEWNTYEDVSATSGNVVSYQNYSYPNSLELEDWEGNYILPGVATSGITRFRFQYFQGEANFNHYFLINFKENEGNVGVIKIGCANLVYCYIGLNDVIDLGPLNSQDTTWHKILFEWDASANKVRAKFDNNNWSIWDDPYDIESFNFVNKLTLFNADFADNDVVFFDDFSSSFCGDFITQTSCLNMGCYWYYSEWLYEFFCVPTPPGECESGMFDCQNCLTEISCEAEDLCYWFDDRCKFGTGACGYGLALVFCENQNDCEVAGGYWYDDFCWLSAPVDLTSWEDYYNEYGDYATSSVWISNMASNTSLFLGQIGGFLSVFENNFDLREAFEWGKNFGEVIPKARGYLAIFNNFLGGFPIGELFAFLLIFMIAVGIFRIMRNLFQLLKFW